MQVFLALWWSNYSFLREPSTCLKNKKLPLTLIQLHVTLSFTISNMPTNTIALRIIMLGVLGNIHQMNNDQYAITFGLVRKIMQLMPRWYGVLSHHPSREDRWMWLIPSHNLKLESPNFWYNNSNQGVTYWKMLVTLRFSYFKSQREASWAP